MISDKIKEVALKYVGEKETAGNSGFEDPEFQKKMEHVGWQKGQAWCSYCAENIWKEAYKLYKPEIVPLLDKLFSASATTTYKNFDLSPEFEVSRVPVVGALAVWRHGVGWQGHIGTVIEFGTVTFKAVEGNTNSEGGREGIEVAIKSRMIDYDVKPNGLNLIGFVIPKQ